MSLQTLISSIGGWAANFISKILPSSQKFLNIASAIVNFIKTTDGEHPELLNAIVAIIPGTVDDYLLTKLREKLPAIMVGMKLVTDELNKTPNQILSDGIKVVNSMADDYKKTAYGTIWIHISNELTDDGVSISDLQKLQQTFYEQIGVKSIG